MVRRISYFPFLFFILLCIFVLILPQEWSNKIREKAVTLFAPSKNQAISFEKLEHVQMENLVLKDQLSRVLQVIDLQQQNEKNWLKLTELSAIKKEEPYWKEFFERRKQLLQEHILLQSQAIPARVIFRDPNFWSSSLWIDVGENENRKLGKKIISENSPVVTGTSVVGIVEYVGEQHSRVRLITDCRLFPSVRAIRGNEQNRFLASLLKSSLELLTLREDLFERPEDREQFLQYLLHLQQKLQIGEETFYLAKGELSGSSAPLWRNRGPILRGLGFNYDFADSEGPARNLRTGTPISSSSSFSLSLPLLKLGDLLVTTGMDGVFPPELHVATVTKILPLREGGCTYELEASATAKDLNNLKEVFVVPSISFNTNLN